MNTRTLVLVATLILSLGAVLGPSASGDHPACTGDQTTSCGGHVLVPQVASPFYFTTGIAGIEGAFDQLGADDPHWLVLRSLPTAPNDDYVVTVTPDGNVVAGLDIFKLRREVGGGETDDQITPKCPQDLVYDLLPAGGAGVGSAAHLAQIRELTLDHHKTIPPAPAGGTISVSLDRHQEWVVIIDARAGVSTADDASEVRYTISVDEGVFRAVPRQPSRPVEVSEWTENGGFCFAEFQAFVNGIVDGVIPPGTIPPLPVSAAPELGGLLPVSIDDLLGSHLG